MIATVDPGQPGWPLHPGRTRAYPEALAEAGLPVDEELVVTVRWGGASGADAMARLLSLRVPPTAGGVTMATQLVIRGSTGPPDR